MIHLIEFIFPVRISVLLGEFTGKQGKIVEYYKRQERLVEGFNEMDTINEFGCLPASLTEVSSFFFPLYLASVRVRNELF